MGFDNLKKMEYAGRIIILGADRTGENTIVVYAVTGRSPSSQARRIVLEKNRLLVRPSDESLVQMGRVDLLIYPAVVLSRRGIAVRNGRQTDDVLAELQGSSGAVEILKKSLSSWAFEPDKPAYTPRISGCVLPSREAALSIIKRGGDGSVIRDYFDVPIRSGEGLMMATYSGENKDPLPSFSGEPAEVSIFEQNASSTAEAVYEALKPEEREKDFRVAVACVYCRDIAHGRFTHAIINRGERKT